MFQTLSEPVAWVQNKFASFKRLHWIIYTCLDICQRLKRPKNKFIILKEEEEKFKFKTDFVIIWKSFNTFKSQYIEINDLFQLKQKEEWSMEWNKFVRTSNLEHLKN